MFSTYQLINRTIGFQSTHDINLLYFYLTHDTCHPVNLYTQIDGYVQNLIRGVHIYSVYKRLDTNLRFCLDLSLLQSKSLTSRKSYIQLLYERIFIGVLFTFENFQYNC